MDDRTVSTLIVTLGTSIPLTITAVAGFWKVTHNQEIARQERMVDRAEVKQDLTAAAANVKSEVKSAAETVKAAVDEKTEQQSQELGGTLGDIKTLVNGRMGEMLQKLGEAMELLGAIEPAAIEAGRKRLKEQKDKGYT